MSVSRRSFLSLSGAIAGSLATAGPMAAWGSQPVATPWQSDGGYGPLRPAVDETTGLRLLDLPEGFRYLTFGWTGEPMDDERPTPARHDGMAVVAADGQRLTLVRNHEVVNDRGSFGPDDVTYDPAGGGGTTNFQFDAQAGRLIRTWASLGGTMQNCAGGPTPWGSWLSCEELVINPGFVIGDGGQRREIRLRRKHGYVFEVPAEGLASAEPLVAMGQFTHEAAAVDPRDGVVYQTEDRKPEAGFYRFLPEKPGQLHHGGRLQMMRVKQYPDMRRHLPNGEDLAVEWVDIEHPEYGHTPGTMDMSGVVKQGLTDGASAFTRLEGCWYADGKVYFTATNGGFMEKGQVFCFDPEQQSVRQVYESPGTETLDHPDNITLSPNGCVVICEDGGRTGQMLMGLTTDGQLFPLVRNAVELNGEYREFTGDYRGSEWCGACFSPDGRWLFANVQKPGFSAAITGPWDHGRI